MSLFHLHDLLSSLLSTDWLHCPLFASVAGVVLLLLDATPVLIVLALIGDFLAFSTN
jgi:hypothetical protein